jgi:hypothetical protein
MAARVVARGRGEASGEEGKCDCAAAWELLGIRIGWCGTWATCGGGGWSAAPTMRWRAAA